jgi:hypothetical protein
MIRSVLLLAGALACLGCGTPRPVNPSFALSPSQAREALREMSQSPSQLKRPVVIVGGIYDPAVGGNLWKHRIRKVTDGPVIDVVVGFYCTFDECRDKVIEAVDAAFPSDDPQWTSEVDVIGVSLGGLVARYASAPARDGAGGRRLKMARLFSVASPHQGARWAKGGGIYQLQWDMKPASPFMNYLAEMDREATYEHYPYVLRGDWIVGREYAAPPGKETLWLAAQAIHSLGPHQGSWHDKRIVADVARRLRGEEAWSQRVR